MNCCRCFSFLRWLCHATNRNTRAMHTCITRDNRCMWADYDQHTANALSVYMKYSHSTAFRWMKWAENELRPTMHPTMREYLQWRDPKVALLNILPFLSLLCWRIFMFVSTTCCSLSNNCRHKLMPVCYRRSHVRWFAAAFAYWWWFVCARERSTGKHSAPGLLPERWSGIHKFGERTNVCCIANPWWYCMHLANTEHIRVVRAATSTSCCCAQYIFMRETPHMQHTTIRYFGWESPGKSACCLLPFHSLRGACTHTFVLGSMYLCCMRVYERDCVRVCVARFSDSGLSSRQIPCHRTSSKL